ncbi:PREDICTED: paired immunoglobulin-like type 2 receptor alpha isoform X1 [Dipodomys ordii]|uniref:paired immunoglobulin-like type 2 receptor alpha isoform X1 n=1 Tax=Dipodomys ordii TaxID=10020 RepID=UPI000651190D|nr:PREDICTED: paired immunoglobulin-like type 2 receptor alpha isoform X1 [Dipodomys ordii]XP_012887234.1 PREDICTED: paired immunoglobulin-like type 2 receptor alpha isoform X1 [Dipodomys ordii]
MRWVLVALLLLPAGVLTADGNFGMKQPKHLSAIVGGSIEIPFSFFHPWELPRNPKVKLFWRWMWFHGEFIYNTTPPFIHKHFKDRLVLNFTKDRTSGSLSILNLRKEDENMYFCRIHLKTKEMGEQQWQSIKGTNLTITEAIKTTTQMKTTTERSTSVASEVTSAGFTVSESQPLSLGAIVGVAVATAMLITGVLVLMAFLRWRRKGQTTTAQTPAGEVSQNTEEKYENIAYERQHTEPQQSPKNESTVYAVLTLSNSSPRMPSGPPLHGNTQEEMTLYSVLKTK